MSSGSPPIEPRFDSMSRPQILLSTSNLPPAEQIKGRSGQDGSNNA